MDRTASFSQVFDDHLFEDHHRAMQPGIIAVVIRRFVDLLELEMGGRLDQLSPSEEVDLVQIVFDIIVRGSHSSFVLWYLWSQYTASSQAFFSPAFPSAATKKPLLAFDNVFSILFLTSLPSLLRSPAEKLRNNLLSQLQTWWTTTTDEDRKVIAPAYSTLLEAAAKEGWEDRDWASLMLAELWALEGNAPYGRHFLSR